MTEEVTFEPVAGLISDRIAEVYRHSHGAMGIAYV